MKFTTPCFIRKNTPELRQKLEELGYEMLGDCAMPVLLADDGEVTSHEDCFLMDCLISDPIDCGDHIEQFLTLAAMREDADLNQWFISPGGCLHKCTYGNWCDDKILSSVWRKATPAELISHFTEKVGK